jgi:hypothetical protein
MAGFLPFKRKVRKIILPLRTVGCVMAGKLTIFFKPKTNL